MGLTPKQERNGIPEMEPGHNTADTATAWSSPVGEATSAGLAQSEQGLPVMLGEGLPSAAQTEWDAGLAVSEQPGEM